jgi:hypothetical protein
VFFATFDLPAKMKVYLTGYLFEMLLVFYFCQTFNGIIQKRIGFQHFFQRMLIF